MIPTLISKLPLKRLVEESVKEDGTFDRGYFIDACTEALRKCRVGLDKEKIRTMAGLCEGITRGQAEFISNVLSNHANDIIVLKQKVEEE